jgi:hypothetical protein
VFFTNSFWKRMAKGINYVKQNLFQNPQFLSFNQIKQPDYEYASTQNNEIDYES